MRRYVVMASDASILLTDWTWPALEHVVRRAPELLAPVWIFRTRRSAERARRSFGRGAWRGMQVVPVWPTRWTL